MTDLAADAADLCSRFGGRVDRHAGHDRWWVTDPGPEATDAARAAGLAVTRKLHQMRRPLPLDGPAADRAPIVTRSFDAERDAEAWLAVNNAAFDWHPDQGGWTDADLAARRAEPWFDADDLRVLDAEDRPGLAGFCWTKVHPADPAAGEPDARGEIYVIAVAPDHTGRGLGTALTVAGLDWLWTRRRTPVALLYVEHDNAPALATYRHLGFTVTATDVAFEPAGAQP